MSVSLRSIFSSLGNCVQKAVDTATGLTSYFYISTENSSAQIFPDPYSKSISHILSQAKALGSMLVRDQYQEVLVEVMRNKDARWVLKATDGSTIVEGKHENSQALWEAKVSKYLQKLLANDPQVSFGVAKTQGKNRKDATLWLTAKRIFLQYLYLSGQFLTPWTNQNVRFSCPFYDSTLDFQHTTLFAHNVLQGLTMGAASSLVNKNVRPLAIASLLPMLPSINALQQVEKRSANPVTISKPLPDLTIAPGVHYTEQLDMIEHFTLSDPNNYLELSIKQSNGNPAPSWLTLYRSGLNHKADFYLGGYGQGIVVVGSLAYVNIGIGFKIFDIKDPLNIAVLGFWSGSIQNNLNNNFHVKDGFVFLYNTITDIAIFDASNPSKIALVKNIANPSGYYSLCMEIVGNYLYHFRYYSSISGSITYFNYQMVLMDITNPSNPIVKSPILIESTQDYYSLLIEVDNNDLYVFHRYEYFVYNLVQPSSPALVTKGILTMAPSVFSANNKYSFFDCGSGLCIYDFTQPSNPQLLSKLSLSGNPYYLLVKGVYLYASGGGINVVNIENLREPLLVDFYPTINSGARIYSASNTLYVADTYVLTILNDAERTLSATPQLGNRGLMELKATATDPLGNSATGEFSIHVGEINVAPIPNQQVYAGNTTLFTFAPNTFEFPQATFTYTANLIGGLPLPSFISFDSNSRTFVFAPVSGDQNTYRIEVTADDGSKQTATTFNLNVPNRPPLIELPLSNVTANSGEPFEYIFSADSFSDLDRDTLTYTVGLMGSTRLPKWLNFDPSLRKFYGTPFGRGVYRLKVTASDGSGGAVTNYFTITVPNTAPLLLNPLGTQLASIGISYSFTFSSNTFYDIDGDVLTYSTGQLPNFLTFNPATRTFSGTPQAQDLGSYTIALQAQDGFGGTNSTTFTLSAIQALANNPPVLAISIPNLNQRAGLPFSYTFDSGTFVDPEGEYLTYEATLEGGAALPAGLYFNSNTRTISGMLDLPQILRISIKAIDPAGAYAINTFTLEIIDNQSVVPIVLNPLPSAIATVGQHFTYPIPHDTFLVPNGEKPEISVVQKGGKPLPEWLKWDSVTNSLYGVPGMWDTGTYSDHQISLEAWAMSGEGSSKAPFFVTVQGQSFWEIFIKTGISLGSIGVSVVGFWKSRALLWNHFMREKYRKLDERAIVGAPFNRQIKLDFNKVKQMQVLHKGRLLVKLPDGLKYQDNVIQGTPLSQKNDRYTIRIIDQDGYVNEEFDLIIKNDSGDPDPVVNDSGFLPNISPILYRSQRRDVGDPENRKSVMMKPLIDKNQEDE